MLKPVDFFGVHNHTMFSNIVSFKDSTVKIKDLLLKAHELGHSGVAITDHANISAHIQALQTTQALKKDGKLPEDFVLGLGVEAYVVDEKEMTQAVEANQSTNFYHLVLIAKDDIGHHQIRQLTSRAYQRAFTYKGILRVPMFYDDFNEIIGQEKGHLIATSACLGGFMGKTVTQMLTLPESERQAYKDRIYAFMCWALDWFGEDFYLELQPSFNQEQIDYNEMLIKIANAYQVPYLIATDTHYLRPENRRTHEIFLKSDDKNSGGRELGDFYNDTYLHSVEEMREKLAYLGEDTFQRAILNTQQVASKIQDYDLAHEQIIPKIPLPPRMEWGHYPELYEMAKDYPHIREMATNDEPYDNYLINLIFKGMTEKEIPVEDWHRRLSRLDIECKELIGVSKAKKQAMSAYFITLQKCIDLFWTEANSIVGTSRGSAAGFELSFILKITQISPLDQPVEMPHWRFLTAERVDTPDIDVDLPSTKRDIAFEVVQRYMRSIGGDIIRCATFGTETARSAITTACRGLGIDSNIARHLSSLIPIVRGKVRDLKTCYYGNDELEPVYEFVSICDQYKELGLIEVAMEIEGLVNKASIHSCGVFLVNEDFSTHNAIHIAPNGEYVSAWDLSDSEYVGNIKYDFLVTRSCAMIQTCVESLIEAGHMEWQGSLRATYEKYLLPSVLEQNDPVMWDKLNNAQVISAFQMDSPAGVKALAAIRPKSIVELAAANTLLRLQSDGDEQPIDAYVRYKEDITRWYEDMRAYGLNEDEITLLKEHLDVDYGVSATQESMMMLSMDKRIAGFNVVEANLLRKAVAK